MPPFEQIPLRSTNEEEQSTFSRIACEAYQSGSQALSSATRFVADHPWETAGTLALAAGALYLGRGKIAGWLGKGALGAEAAAGSEAVLGKGMLQAAKSESALTSSILKSGGFSAERLGATRQIETSLLAHDMVAGELNRFPIAGVGLPGESMSTSIVDRIGKLAAQEPSLAGKFQAAANPITQPLASNMWPMAERTAAESLPAQSAAMHNYLLGTESIEHSLLRLTPHAESTSIRLLGSDQARRSVLAYLLSNVRF